MSKILGNFGYLLLGMGGVFFGWRITLNSLYASIGLALLAFLLIVCAEILEGINK